MVWVILGECEWGDAIFFDSLIHLFTQSYNKIPSEVQVIDFQKIPVVLSNRGAYNPRRKYEIRF